MSEAMPVERQEAIRDEIEASQSFVAKCLKYYGEDGESWRNHIPRELLERIVMGDAAGHSGEDIHWRQSADYLLMAIGMKPKMKWDFMRQWLEAVGRGTAAISDDIEHYDITESMLRGAIYALDSHRWI